MTDRLSRWGVGPRIAAAALLWAAFALVATRKWPGLCRMRFLSDAASVTIGAALLVFGVCMLIIAARACTAAYNHDRLVTSGIFSVVRHPIYSAWIVLIVPGLAFLCRSWPMLFTSLVAWAAFKKLIHREDEYIERRFGPAYLEYRARVSEIIPLPRLHGRPAPHS